MEMDNNDNYITVEVKSLYANYIKLEIEFLGYMPLRKLAECTSRPRLQLLYKNLCM